jgi:hypothetical protein
MIGVAARPVEVSLVEDNPAEAELAEEWLVVRVMREFCLTVLRLRPRD